MADVLVGRIKNINSRGFGFIETENQIDFFFHHTSYKGDWKHLLQKYVSNKIIIVHFQNDPDAPHGPRAIEVEIENIME